MMLILESIWIRIYLILWLVTVPSIWFHILSNKESSLWWISLSRKTPFRSSGSQRNSRECFFSNSLIRGFPVNSGRSICDVWIIILLKLVWFLQLKTLACQRIKLRFVSIIILNWINYDFDFLRIVLAFLTGGWYFPGCADERLVYLYIDSNLPKLLRTFFPSGCSLVAEE